MKQVLLYMALGIIIGCLVAVALLPGHPGGVKLKEALDGIEKAIKRNRDKSVDPGGSDIPKPLDPV